MKITKRTSSTLNRRISTPTLQGRSPSTPITRIKRIYSSKPTLCQTTTITFNLRMLTATQINPRMNKTVQTINKNKTLSSIKTSSLIQPKTKVRTDTTTNWSTLSCSLTKISLKIAPTITRNSNLSRNIQTTILKTGIRIIK